MPDGTNSLSQRKLAIAYWVSKNKYRFKQVRVILLLVVVAAILIVAAAYFIIWIVNVPKTNRIHDQAGQSPVLFDSVTRVQPLQITQNAVVPRGDDTVDAIVRLQNPNATWAAERVDLQIQLPGVEPYIETVSLAPGQEYAVVGNNISGATSSSVQATIQDIVWKREPNIEVLPQPSWDFQDATISSITSAQPGSPKSQLTFTLKNNSIYGFRDIEVIAVVEGANGSVLAVGSLPISEIQTLETKPVVIRWPQTVSTAAEPKIMVNVDTLTDSQVIR